MFVDRWGLDGTVAHLSSFLHRCLNPLPSTMLNGCRSSMIISANDLFRSLCLLELALYIGLTVANSCRVRVLLLIGLEVELVVEFVVVVS